MKEFGFYPNDLPSVVLGDEVEFCNDENSQFVVANSKKLKAYAYAPQIDFYIKNTKDEMLEIAKNVSTLYETAAICFDEAKDQKFSQSVGKKVILVSDEDESELIDELKKDDFKVIALKHAEVKFIYGGIGDLNVLTLNQTDEYEVVSDFVLVKNAKEYMLRQSGVYEILGLENSEILALLNRSTPEHSYRNFTIYNDKICQYADRRSEHCGKCADVCPSVAILKNDDEKKLEFSHVDCIECGECISVCPSGALEISTITRACFGHIAEFYKDKISLLTCEKNLQSLGEISLPKGVLPFIYDGEKSLDEVNFLTILQESSRAIVVYAKNLGVGTKEAINVVNKIYQNLFGKKAIFLAQNSNEIENALQNALNIGEIFHLNLNEYNLSKKEIFSRRILAMLDDENHGIIESGEYLRYGEISINTDTCTLCASCVGACNIGALYADKSDNTIKFNASLCTTCGYCEKSCAEKDTLNLARSGLRLEKSFFEYKILAKDELFKCIECGKEFATKKAIMKIATFMGEKFSSDTDYAKTLFCCADCKAKIMIKKQLL